MQKLFFLILFISLPTYTGEFTVIECLNKKTIPINPDKKPLLKKMISASSTLSDLTTTTQPYLLNSSPCLYIPLKKNIISFFLDNAELITHKKTAYQACARYSLKKNYFLLEAADFLGHESALKVLKKSIVHKTRLHTMSLTYSTSVEALPLSLIKELEKQCVFAIGMDQLSHMIHFLTKHDNAIKIIDQKPEWAAKKYQQIKDTCDMLIKNQEIIKKNRDWHRYDISDSGYIFGSVYGKTIFFKQKHDSNTYTVYSKEQDGSLNDICFSDSATILIALNGKIIKWKPLNNQEKTIFSSDDNWVDRLTIHKEKNLAAAFHTLKFPLAHHVTLWSIKPWRMLTTIAIPSFEGHAFQLILNDTAEKLYINVKGSNTYDHLIIDCSQHIKNYDVFQNFLSEATLKDLFLMLYGCKDSTTLKHLKNNKQLIDDIAQAHPLVQHFYQSHQSSHFFYQALTGLYSLIRYFFS